MEYVILCLLFFITIYIIYNVYIQHSYKNVLANDGNFYVLKNIYANEQEELQSANTLAEINRRVTLLIKNLDHGIFWVQILNSKYSSNRISEALVQHGITSFTVNKQDIHICIRTRNVENKLYDINTLMFVIIHELAHMANYTQNGDSIEGHGPEFIQKFRFLLQKAINIGVYSYINYAQTPQEYCGMNIDSTVL